MASGTIYLTTYQEYYYKINYIKFLDNQNFASLNKKIRQCSTAKFIDQGKEKFWIIEAQDVSTLQTLLDEEIAIVKPSNADQHILPSKSFAKKLNYLECLKLTPYDYQKEGISFLIANPVAILADEMGLGKTPQFLTTIFILFKEKLLKSSLIVCPSAIKYQIAAEIEKWFDLEQDDFTFKVVDGTKKQRQKIYNSFAFEMPTITIINYELLKQDIEILESFHFDALICDEAHRLKNAKSLTHKSVKRIECNRKYLVTGTPICRDPLDLFNLFLILDKKILGSYPKFAKEFLIIGDKFSQRNAILAVKDEDKLFRKIHPFMIRRLKKDVLKSLPPLVISNYYVEMTKEQASLQERLWEDFREFQKKISDSTEYNDAGEIIRQDPRADALRGYIGLMHCLSDSPELLLRSPSKMAQKYSVFLTSSDKPSPKIKECIDICKELISINPMQKIVIFTQYERMQKLTNEFLSQHFSTILINGSLSAKEKMSRITEFRTGSTNILIGTNAMNYGINLPEANMCICLDQSWTPDVENQRYGRVHRANSNHDVVNVINLLSKNSIDEQILHVLQTRQESINNIIENSKQTNNFQNEVESLLTNRAFTKKYFGIQGD